jgi:gamma-glutamyltranspeptidase/glutathione hydrolase
VPARKLVSRSDVVARDGVVATSQPLAAQAGLDIIRRGGNAIDAAVATAAVLDVVEPFSTGCGGDAFTLIHLANKSEPLSYNGSGKSGSLVDLEDLQKKGWASMPVRGGPPVTVPGALHLWCTIVEEHGTLQMKDVLEPAIHYAREGFPVSPLVGLAWKNVPRVLRNDAARQIFGDVPKVGQMRRNRDLADTFELVVKNGADAFYTGRTAESIVKTVQEDGGFLTLEDLASHKTAKTKPISTDYRGVTVYEHPPNGQGFAALSMLNIMETYDFSEFEPLSTDRYHIMIEAKKLAYADLHQHNADPNFYDVPLEKLLAKSYAKKRAELIDLKHSMNVYTSGLSLGHDTIYLATADGEGNAVSFINSLYLGIGSGLVADGTGIKLQNRGCLFSLDSDHPNRYAPRKLPFHTIIPGALYKDKHFLGVFGIMGGSHQAQAHAQFVSNLVDHGMSPQEAIDFPRFDHNHETNEVGLEDEIPARVQSELQKRGHLLIPESAAYFGGGQAILRLEDAWIAGSDYRMDGQAAGF